MKAIGWRWLGVVVLFIALVLAARFIGTPQCEAGSKEHLAAIERVGNSDSSVVAAALDPPEGVQKQVGAAGQRSKVAADDPLTKTAEAASGHQRHVVAWADERAKKNVPVRQEAIRRCLAMFEAADNDERMLVATLRSLANQSAFTIYDAQGRSHYPGQPGDSADEIRAALRHEAPGFSRANLANTNIMSNGGAIYHIAHNEFQDFDEFSAIEARYHPSVAPLGELPIGAILQRAQEALSYQ